MIKACGGLIGALVIAVAIQAADRTVPDAAMAGDRDAVRALIKQGADVNAVQGDGVTALHWAAINGDADLAAMLLTAGANPRAQTRFGGYTPLHVAAEHGHADVVRRLIRGGADVQATTSTRTTALMLGASSGDTGAIAALVEAGADVNAREAERGHTPLMFAAAANRVDAVKLLLKHKADPAIATIVTDLAALSAGGQNPDGRNLPTKRDGRSGGGGAPAAGATVRMPGVERPYFFNELVHAHGGMTPLLFAARQGYTEVVAALLEAGVDVNQAKAGDDTTPLLIATINGHFDFAKMLLERGADPNRASENGVTPLYAVINLQWAQEAGYPQPWAHLDQKLGYLDYMKLLLDSGANPNARVNKKVWYSGYNFDQSDVEETGATPFWRAAYGADVDAMKLLVAYGADPNLPTTKAPARARDAGGAAPAPSSVPPIPVGGPAIFPIHAASGAGFGLGFAGTSHRSAPSGMLAAVKYLVDELHVDVNQRDDEGNTALHNAAARGDNDMVLYLVSKGADVKAVNRAGQTTVDMANGPVQRTQPFPETIAILEKLGAKNNHRCVSC